MLFCGNKVYDLWNEPVTKYSHNFTIALITGIISSIIPLLFGLNLGSKLKSKLFHLKIKNVLRSISEKRSNNKIDKNTAQELVIDIVNAFSDGIINEPWYQEVIKYNQKPNMKEVDCGVCGKAIEMIENKCSNCKLNCFAWGIKQ
ncbi:hypothetical protein C1H87_12540 [Flavivirga eckloniae]|uniref:Uncharacterized protein n=2 Tax=Flavivirga eckloniae TaxID=1803846 RepID=A0A2K9PQZ9_9FLAO|nr:hypothetical protein C1H87_12540 [Flavivirga eckloniae]